MQNTGRVGKPRLGVTVATLNSQNGMWPNGAYVVSVDAGSPAEKAGIQAGDIIVEVDGNVVSNNEDLMNSMEGKNAGDTIRLTVWRPAEVGDTPRGEISIEGKYIENIEAALALLDEVAQ